MKKSRRLYLSPLNYDEKLVSIQMADEKGELPRDPVEIIGYAPRETARTTRIQKNLKKIKNIRDKTNDTIAKIK